MYRIARDALNGSVARESAPLWRQGPDAVAQRAPAAMLPAITADAPSVFATTARHEDRVQTEEETLNRGMTE
jgi:hypothetical protein